MITGTLEEVGNKILYSSDILLLIFLFYVKDIKLSFSTNYLTITPFGGRALFFRPECS